MTAKKKEELVIAYSKEQIIKSKKYLGNLDLLNSILEDGKSYSFNDVDTLIDKFKKGKVK